MLQGGPGASHSLRIAWETISLQGDGEGGFGIEKLHFNCKYSMGWTLFKEQVLAPLPDNNRRLKLSSPPTAEQDICPQPCSALSQGGDLHTQLPQEAAG